MASAGSRATTPASKVDFHTGSIDGMVAIAGLIRDQRVGVYVLANIDHAELRHALMYKTIRSVPRAPGARLEHRDAARSIRVSQPRATLARRKRRRSACTGTRPALALDRYTGTYTNPAFGAVTVVGARRAIARPVRRGLRRVRSSTGTTTPSRRPGTRNGEARRLPRSRSISTDGWGRWPCPRACLRAPTSRRSVRDAG